MRYAELHYFADQRFVAAAAGAPLFVWGVYDLPDGSPLPTFPDAYGFAVDVTSSPPASYATYTPETDTWGARIAGDAVPELQPFYYAVWHNEDQTWHIDPA